MNPLRLLDSRFYQTFRSVGGIITQKSEKFEAGINNNKG